MQNPIASGKSLTIESIPPQKREQQPLHPNEGGLFLEQKKGQSQMVSNSFKAFAIVKVFYTDCA